MNDQQYGIGQLSDLKPVDAPELPYLPKNPEHYNPGIGLIGCGGISEHHLGVYQKAGYRVLALCDIDEAKARQRAQAFYPNADVYTDAQAVLERDDIEVVDLAVHPPERRAMLSDALKAGKHVLSQKPFVHDLDFGEEMVALAREQKCKLAVNQNGRWAPHFSYIRQAIQQGYLGEVASVHMTVDWDHGWTADTPFNRIKHLILYDFAVHWFDMVSCLLADHSAEQVFARVAHTTTQRPDPPMLAQATLQFDRAQASLAFNGDTRFAQQDRTMIVGAQGTAVSIGPDLLNQQVSLATEKGIATPTLKGHWFENGFHGAMAELLCAIEEDREPYHNAADNLRSLALCFAAVQSAETGQPQIPGSVRQLPKA